MRSLPAYHPAMGRYRAEEPFPHFCTITVLEWLPVLIEARYMDPIIDSLKFCRKQKDLELFAYVIMPNHVHLMAGTAGDLHAIMRDFKRFTSRQIHDRLKEDGRQTLLDWLRRATEHARRERGELGLWQDGFHPQVIKSPQVLEQKLRYLHENPVRKGLVTSSQDWWYSSARNYLGIADGCMEVDSPY